MCIEMLKSKSFSVFSGDQEYEKLNKILKIVFWLSISFQPKIDNPPPQSSTQEGNLFGVDKWQLINHHPQPTIFMGI